MPESPHSRDLSSPWATGDCDSTSLNIITPISLFFSYFGAWFAFVGSVYFASAEISQFKGMVANVKQKALGNGESKFRLLNMLLMTSGVELIAAAVLCSDYACEVRTVL